jgi:mRNA-degrading endonuclease RelE of RelBE toxin-antitoxin system
LAYQVLQKPRFRKQVRKLNAHIKTDVDAAVLKIVDNPKIGERKKGDLANLLVYKFNSQHQQYLLGYTVDDGIYLVYLETIAPHENFYRDIKRK